MNTIAEDNNVTVNSNNKEKEYVEPRHNSSPKQQQQQHLLFKLNAVFNETCGSAVTPTGVEDVSSSMAVSCTSVVATPTTVLTGNQPNFNNNNDDDDDDDTMEHQIPMPSPARFLTEKFSTTFVSPSRDEFDWVDDSVAVMSDGTTGQLFTRTHPNTGKNISFEAAQSIPAVHIGQSLASPSAASPKSENTFPASSIASRTRRYHDWCSSVQENNLPNHPVVGTKMRCLVGATTTTIPPCKQARRHSPQTTVTSKTPTCRVTFVAHKRLYQQMGPVPLPILAQEKKAAWYGAREMRLMRIKAHRYKCKREPDFWKRKAENVNYRRIILQKWYEQQRKDRQLRDKLV